MDDNSIVPSVVSSMIRYIVSINLRQAHLWTSSRLVGVALGRDGLGAKL